jgi:ribosomal protein S18 acetylase RimI-like enzyme
MPIRPAQREDLEACLAIDPSYITDRVWQLVEQTHGEETTLTFRSSRLPRLLRVEYPRPLPELAEGPNDGRCFLVAEQDKQIIGLIDLTLADWQKTAWLRHLVVAEPFRRRGVGSKLLRAALTWAEQSAVLTVMAECQTKNFPAISLYRKNGFVFCGHNDHYYTNKDIALFFAARLK